ncbi:CMP-sialic acid synthetase [Vibrio sp. 10N.286.49.B3]|uniref:acylneuraminate cytidylyltransferase family protein n=1 Tax=Vibrio sp. 10N.286.49.B3 TaxID=1880855 RepID=UPI000C865C36|nr:acylneuraminate cytidylyltransferase family protein [Vibrio sp. 10N.286.49.B3]PMH45973.1 CMP-sialic acid synthetase [Vibrio sp. 10N.286.49.B3]
MNIALITARGGSKGLPRKNVLPLNGTPLIGITIQAALASKNIDRVYVTTEDDEIKKISAQFGAEIIDRPLELASDTSTSAEAIEHAIQYLNKTINFDTIVLLQPTSPLRTSHHIDHALTIYHEKKADCVLSVFEPSHTPIKAYIEQENGMISGLFSPDAPYTRRQDLPKSYQPNGAIYIFSVTKFKLHNLIPRDNVFPYVMSELESADIDTIDDFTYVEQLLKSRK